jgi:hypothetical protein
VDNTENKHRRVCVEIRMATLSHVHEQGHDRDTNLEKDMDMDTDTDIDMNMDMKNLNGQHTKQLHC